MGSVWRGFSFSLIAANPGKITGVFLESGHGGFVTSEPLAVRALKARQHALVVLGYDLDETRHHLVPSVKNLLGARALGISEMLFNHGPDLGDLGGRLEFFDAHHLRVDAGGKIAAFVEHVGDAARHAGRKIAAGRAEHDDASAGHVFATVITHGLDHGVDAAVADREALTRHAAEVGFAASGAVEGHVADN